MLRRRITLLAIAAIVLLPPAPAWAESEDARAKTLLAQYRDQLKASRDIRDDDGWNAFVRRLNALRTLGPMRCARAREGLLRIARTGKRLDDRILAAQGIARHADLASVQKLLDVLAKKPHPVLAEVTAEALGANTEAGVAAWLAQAPGALKHPAARAMVLRAGRAVPMDVPMLAALFDQHVADTAAGDLVYDAVQALGRAAGPEASARVLRAAEHTDRRIRLAAADVLPVLVRDAKTDATVRKLLGDDAALVRYAMLMALGEAKALHFVPQISERLADDHLRVRKTALDVLKRMTGKDFGFDQGAWRRWHEQKNGEGKPGTPTVVSYHGVPIWSDRLAFILDRSGSMRWPSDPGVTTRMAVAQAELQRVLGLLPKRTLFNVLAFDSDVYAWRKAEAVAEPKSIAKAQRWTAKQKAERRAFTNTYGVLERTLLQNPRIDTIYLLSDGIPEWGDIMSREGLLAAVRDWNRYRRITINTFAITHLSMNPGKYKRTSSMKRAATFMRDLAHAGNGTYRFIARPPK